MNLIRNYKFRAVSGEYSGPILRSFMREYPLEFFHCFTVADLQKRGSKLPFCLSGALRLQVCITVLGFYIRNLTWIVICVASTLTTEQLPQPSSIALV